MATEIILFFFFTYNNNYYIDFCSKTIFDGPADDPNYNPLPEDRPGGFNWGEGERIGADNNDQE